MTLITKEYRVLKYGVYSGITERFTVIAKAENVDRSFRRLKARYPEESGYWLVHMSDEYKEVGS